MPAFFGTLSVMFVVAIGTALCRENAGAPTAPSRAACWPALAAGVFMAIWTAHELKAVLRDNLYGKVDVNAYGS